MRQSQPNPRRASYSAPYVPFATVRDGADSVERRTGPAMGAWNRAALDLSNCGARVKQCARPLPHSHPLPCPTP